MIERDLTLFPEDETGNALWQLLETGNDLISPHEVEFSVIFPTEKQALGFGQFLLENNQKLSFCQYQGDEQRPWEITAYPQMPLTHQNISAYQQLLESHCEAFEGKYDGWFCPSVTSLIEQ